MLLGAPVWNRPMQPVVFVGWDDARAYAKWAEKSLPSEAQWEKARRGTDGRLWAWGNDFYPDRCNYKGSGLGCTSEIGLFDSGTSPYGCFDMCGNVWEMCEGSWLEGRLPMRGGVLSGYGAVRQGDPPLDPRRHRRRRSLAGFPMRKKHFRPRMIRVQIF